MCVQLNYFVLSDHVVISVQQMLLTCSTNRSTNQPMLHYVGNRMNCDGFAFLSVWPTIEQHFATLVYNLLEACLLSPLNLTEKCIPLAQGRSLACAKEVDRLVWTRSKRCSRFLADLFSFPSFSSQPLIPNYSNHTSSQRPFCAKVNSHTSDEAKGFSLPVLAPGDASCLGKLQLLILFKICFTSLAIKIYLNA